MREETNKQVLAVQAGDVKIRLCEETIMSYENWLVIQDYSKGTMEKYLRDIRRYALWCGEDKAVSRESLLTYKKYLRGTGHKPGTVNGILSALNNFCRFAGLEIKLKLIKIQKKIFCDEKKELTKEEYIRLIQTAKAEGKIRLAMIIETMGATGIRVSELKHITVEAVRKGRAQISLKGKIREILLPGKLCKKLCKYIKKEKIHTGEIFVTKTGKGVSRKQVWAEMKKLAETAKVNAEKIFPHNLRHLFARSYYRISHDISKLADLLGHTSIETTRLYLISSGIEHRRDLESMGLVLKL